MIVLLSCTAFFAICIFCYALIFIFILQNKFYKNQSGRNEMRLCGQVAGLVIGFMIQFVYNGGIYVLNSFGQATILRSWRTMGPLAYCFLSCVHPWTCLTFNMEIREGVFNIFCCRLRSKKRTTRHTELFALSRS
ncbi:hypothetical protein OSTOST_14799, partial [Ostertagia ostertagi]